MSLFVRDTPVNVACGVCARHASGHGFTNGPVLIDGHWNPRVRIAAWICDDARCFEAGKALKTMPNYELDIYEAKALREGGDKAGSYLDEVGVTDLAKLRPEEWEEFCRRMIAGYGDSMRQQLLSHTPPF